MSKYIIDNTKDFNTLQYYCLRLLNDHKIKIDLQVHLSILQKKQYFIYTFHIEIKNDKINMKRQATVQMYIPMERKVEYNLNHMSWCYLTLIECNELYKFKI